MVRRSDTVELQQIKAADEQLCLTLPETIESVSTARKYLRSFLEAWKVIEKDITDVLLISSELASNCVRHSHASKPYQMTFSHFDPVVSIRCEDYGVGFDPLSVPDIGVERIDENGVVSMGYGLDLIQKLSDS